MLLVVFILLRNSSSNLLGPDILLKCFFCAKYFSELSSFASAYNVRGLNDMVYKYLSQARNQIDDVHQVAY